MTWSSSRMAICKGGLPGIFDLAERQSIARRGAGARPNAWQRRVRAAPTPCDLESRESFGFAAAPRRPLEMPSQPGTAALSNSLADLRRELATAYRLVANEGMLDAFGHISVRHPGNPNRYFLSRSRAPALVQPEDILEYDLDSNPIVPPTTRPYSERVIHGEIFKARPDVNAV